MQNFFIFISLYVCQLSSLQKSIEDCVTMKEVVAAPNTTTRLLRASTTRSSRTSNANEVTENTESIEEEKTDEEKRLEIWRNKGSQLQAFQDLMKLRKANKGTKRGDIKSVVDKYRALGLNHITRGSLNYAVLVHNLKYAKKPPSEVILESLNTGTSSLTSNEIGACATSNECPVILDREIREDAVCNAIIRGRKKGTTDAEKVRDAAILKEAITDASNLCLNEYRRAQFDDTIVKPGTYIQIIKEIEERNKIKAGTIKLDTIKSRMRRNNTSGYAHQRTSPLAGIEPLIVDYCQRLSEIGAPLTRDQVIHLAYSAIQGTIHYDKLVAFKKKRHLPVPDSDDEDVDEESVIGVSWYYAFLERHKDKIRRGKGKVKDVKRHTWCTYVHFEEMYNCVYAQMENAGVAVKTEEFTSYDKDGKVIVDDSETIFGKPTQYKITHPEMIIFVDECGSNTNQKNDGQVGGQKFVFSKGGDNTGTLGSNTDLHFTVLCFNNAAGEPLLCAIILKSKKKVCEIPLTWLFGIDITKKTYGDENGNQLDFFLQNSKPDGAMSGGPDCYFNGNRIPCFVGASKSASITSTLLSEMLKHMDKFAKFDRSEGKTPFLLLDGHQSRFEVPFLNYIHENDHKWTVCLGVPYGTHIWQVADSSQLNGKFKIELTKAKKKFFNIKRDLGKNFNHCDIVPLVNAAFTQSYGNALGARKAIIERGWGPLNYALLQHEQLLKTKVNRETGEAEINLPLGDQNILDLTTVNMTEGNALCNATDLLLIKRSKQKGYRAKLLKRKREIDSKKTALEKLMLIGKLSSGTMAAGGMYHLCENVNEIVTTDFTGKKIHIDQVKKRQDERHNKTVSLYFEAKDKMNSHGEEKLTGPDIRSILKHHIRQNDSPLRTKVVELREQWNRRKHRLVTEPPPYMKIIEIEQEININENIIVDAVDETTFEL